MNNPVLEAIYARRSVRKYLDTPVEKETLALLADAAVHGPSARNLQPWHLTVITDRDLIREIEEGVRTAMNAPGMGVLYDAPAIFMVSGDSTNRWNNIDCGLATENLLLAAQSLGLGTCVIGFVQRYLNTEAAAGTLEKLHLPEGYTPLFAVTVGYPAETPAARPRQNDRVDWIE